MPPVVSLHTRPLNLVLALLLIADCSVVCGIDLAQPDTNWVGRLPPRLESRFAEALRNPSPVRFHDIDTFLDRARSIQGPGYTWRHYYVYCAGVQAAIARADARARMLLDEYIEGVGVLGATNPIPALVLSCPELNSTRKVIAAYRESLNRRWGDDRWSLHNFRPAQIGWEYESALALSSLVTGTTELPDWIAHTEVGASRPFWRCREATADTRRLVVALRFRQLGDTAGFRQLPEEVARLGIDLAGPGASVGTD